MPPKAKKADGPGKKAEQKKKDKIVEDKTFGLKNKKGSKQQKFIKHVTQQVQYGNQSSRKLEALQNDKLKKKEDKKKELDELNQLFRPAVIQQKVSKGADPKSVVCAFYKQGQCGKGDKCKFSHDLSKERKGEKRSMYDGQDEKADMETWDEAKLEEVIEKKHGEKNKGLPPTSIICKYFLEAVENSKYGWFWECPNGVTCHYKHALPPGFVLKKDRKKEEKEDQITIEELVEKERAALGDNVTKVTLETFLAWKERKKKEKVEKFMSAKEKRKAEFKAGKAFGVSGRELFEFNPDMIVDDDEATDDVYERNDEEEVGEEEEAYDGPVKEIDMEEISRVGYDTSSKGTEAMSRDRTGAPVTSQDDEATKLAQAAALPETNSMEKTDHAIAAALSATVNGDVLAGDVPIDENLFEEEDLDLLEEDLETLDLDQ